MKFNLKSFILGGIVGAMLFSIAPIYATVQQYILTKSEWKLVNGDGEVYIDKDYPALMLNGSNYVPVGKIAQFLGVEFTVDGKNKTATFEKTQSVDTKNTSSTAQDSNVHTVPEFKIGETWDSGDGLKLTLVKTETTPSEFPGKQYFGYVIKIVNNTQVPIKELGLFESLSELCFYDIYTLDYDDPTTYMKNQTIRVVLSVSAGAKCDDLYFIKNNIKLAKFKVQD